MARINSHLLVQELDGQGIVILDESTGEEIVIPVEDFSAFLDALGRLIPAITAAWTGR